MIPGALRAICLALLMAAGGLARPEEARAAEPGRIGLVIGNETYGAPQLVREGAREDAAAIAAALAAAGFDAELLLDADAAGLEAALVRLGERLAAAGPDGAGLFYFNGRAVRAGGVARFLPIDASVGEGEGAPGLDRIVALMAPLPDGRAFIVIDACGALPSDGDDPAGPCAATGLEHAPLIAFSAGEDEAVDPATERVYAQALAASLGVRALAAPDVFEQAAARARAAADGRLRPRIEPGAADEPFYLLSAPSTEDYPPRVAESVRWDYARRIDDADAYRGYLEAYPQGRFVGEALARIEALETPKPAAEEERGVAGIVAIFSSLDDRSKEQAPEKFRAPDPEDILLLETTRGQVAVEMIPELAPEAVARVREAARGGQLDGAPFDRVVDGFRAESSTLIPAGGAEVAALPAELLAPIEPAPTRVDVADSDRSRQGVYAKGDIDFGIYKGVPVAVGADAPDGSWVTQCPGVVSLSQPDGEGAQTLFIMRGEAPGLDDEALAWGRVVEGLEAVYDLAVSGGLGAGAEPDRILTARVASDLAEPPEIAVLSETSPGFAELLAATTGDLGRAPRVCEVRLPLRSPDEPVEVAP